MTFGIERRDPGEIFAADLFNIDYQETVEIVHSSGREALAGETIFYDI